MYTTCISCGAALGTNDVLEHFPVGRRLAFDGARGRLWVLCRGCRAWNLAPIEERWEAVEGAERLFEGAELGAATEHIALGRVGDGTQLVRIGAAPPAELAGWRYGRELMGLWRRRHRLFMAGIAGMGVVGVTVNAGALIMMVAPGAAGWAIMRALGRRPVLRTSEGRLLRRGDADRTRFVTDESVEGWRIDVAGPGGQPLHLTGRPGLRVLRSFLAYLHTAGANEGEVRRAFDVVEDLGRSPRPLHHLALAAGGGADGAQPRRTARAPMLDDLPRELRLALEIAVNDEAEQRALEGELAALQAEWREAEELAAIADALLLPRGVAERIRRWRQRGPPY